MTMWNTFEKFEEIKDFDGVVIEGQKIPLMQVASFIGHVVLARRMFPDKEINAAVLDVIDIARTELIDLAAKNPPKIDQGLNTEPKLVMTTMPSAPTVVTATCGSCGGGAVR